MLNEISVFKFRNSRMLVARGWQWVGMGSYCLMGKEFHFCKMKRTLEKDGDGCSTIWHYWTPWTTHLNMVTNVTLRVVYHNSKKKKKDKNTKEVKRQSTEWEKLFTLLALQQRRYGMANNISINPRSSSTCRAHPWPESSKLKICQCPSYFLPSINCSMLQ